MSDWIATDEQELMLEEVAEYFGVRRKEILGVRYHLQRQVSRQPYLPAGMVPEQIKSQISALCSVWTISPLHFVGGLYRVLEVRESSGRPPLHLGRESGCNYGTMVHERKRRGRKRGRGYVACIAQGNMIECDVARSLRGDTCPHFQRKVLNPDL
jgi:hypothetical protein